MVKNPPANTGDTCSIPGPGRSPGEGNDNPLQYSYLGWAVPCLVTQSCLTLCDPMDCTPPDSSVHGDSLGKNTGVGCHALLQGIFPIWGSTQFSHFAGGFFTF